MIRFTDRVAIGETKETKEGYLVATARVARTGVQLYYASELGDVATKAGFKPSDIVRVYRHPDQVFNSDSLASITRAPVTVDHPPEQVTSDNWSKYSVGEVGDSYSKDGDWIVVNPMIKDAAALRAARSTHKEISMGYDAAIVVARDGLDADFEQHNIRYNHLAIVPKGRAGEKARIGDSWGASPITDLQPGDKPKTEKGGCMSDQLKTVVLGDKAVQVAVTDIAAVEAFKIASSQALADANTAHAAIVSAKDEEIGRLQAELLTAQKAAMIDVDALVEARSELVAKVHAVDSKIVILGKTDAQLKREVVALKMGDAAITSASDDMITGMFHVITKDAKPQNPVAEALKTGVKTFGDESTIVNDAHAQYVARLSRKKGA